MSESTVDHEWSPTVERRRSERGRRWRNEADVDVVAMAAKGDGQAWRELHRRYDGLVLAVARRTGCRGAAGDVSQRTWELLVRSVDSIRDSSRIAGWLATTARREAIREMTRRVPEPVDVDEFAPCRLPKSRSPEAVVIEHETVAAVDHALRALPASYRLLLSQLLADDTPSYRDVASSLGCPIGSIGPMRGRGVRLLRRQLARSGAS
jgi:RNA polymerase sigma factor (sigma-70 family)